MNCIKCGKQLPEGAVWCCWCGRKQVKEPRKRTRANGEGTVYKLDNGRYRAVVTLGYYLDDKGKRHRKTRSAETKTKKEALALLPELKKDGRKKAGTFRELYEAWLPTHEASKSTLDCYKAAYKYFAPVHDLSMDDIDIDDLQDCLDNCDKGKRTKQNMKALCGLVYKYGIPRHVIPENLNLATFLKVDGEGAAHRESFTDVQIEKIRQAIGKVPYADWIYAMIYTGFRPSEFLGLKVENYNKTQRCVVGGAKTKAGKDRTVTLSPKVQPIFKAAIGNRKEGYIFQSPQGDGWNLKNFSARAFYPALKTIGIRNPVQTLATGVERHKYSPHSCRHTFATLLKNAQGAPSDKQRLTGHTSEEMLNYYEDLRIEDLRKITDCI